MASRSKPKRNLDRGGAVARDAERLSQRTNRVPERGPGAGVTAALAVAFFVSGSAGLIHEVVWTRLLGHLFGVSSFAISTVLAAYMGGLALGSWWIGKRTEALADTRRAYAWLELAIGLCALAVPLLLAVVEPLYGLIWRRFQLSFAIFSALRFLLAGAILLVPTMLMGATLPVLADDLARREGRRIPPYWLYTVNLAGAVFGVAAAGFLLLPNIGVWRTILVGAGLNIAVALGVLALPRARARRESAPSAIDSIAVTSSGLLLAAAFLSGLISLATQVAWTRVLVLVVGSTTYAFTSVLLVYLITLGIGGAIASRLAARRARIAPALAVAFLLTSLATVGAVFLVNRLPGWYLGLYSWWSADALGGGAVARSLATSIIVVLPPVICAGMILPLVLAAAIPPGARETGALVGRIYAVNTIGAITGSILGGFVLLPALGTQAAIFCMVVPSVAMGLVFTFGTVLPPVLRAGAVAAAAVVLLGMLLHPTWDFVKLHIGVYESARHRETANDLRSRLDLIPSEEMAKVLYEREGRSASVIVTESGGVVGMKIDARANASDDANDMSTQVMLAQYPLLLAPRVDDVFIIGWGSGVTVGAALQSPAKHVTAVELEPAVVEGARHFEHVNHDPLRDPRVRLYEDDARHILLASEDSYDVIISEPPHPWVAGVANLFTRDFYEIVAAHLRPDGVFVQWVQSYEISFDTYRSILATFQSVFPETIVFYLLTSTDTILVGSRQPMAIDLDELQRRWADPVQAAELKRVGMERPEYLLAGIALGPQDVRKIATGAPLNTDDNMLVEFSATSGMATTGLILGQIEPHATPVESLLRDRDALLKSPERLGAYIEGRRRMERDPKAYERLLRSLTP